MAQKGLFELFFVLIMLVLIFPATTHNKAVSTPNVLVQADNLALLTDYAITDAVFDKVIVDCNFDDYNVNINPYLNNLYTEFNKTSGVNCNYNQPTVSSSPPNYIGSIDVNCDSSNSKIIKTLKFSKQITANQDINLYTCEDKCTLSITDNYAPGNNLNYTNTKNIPGCLQWGVFQDQFDSWVPSNWDIAGLDSASVVSGKLETSGDSSSFSSAAIHTMSPVLSGEFTITTNVEWDAGDQSKLLLYIEGSDGEAYVGFQDDGSLKYIADINGNVSSFASSIANTGNMILKIKRNSSSNLTAQVIDPVVGYEIWNFTDSFIGTIYQISLVNSKDSGSGRIAKWDYITVQDKFT